MTRHEEGLTSSNPSRITVARSTKATTKADGRPIHCLTGFPSNGLTDKTKVQFLSLARRNKKRSWAHAMCNGMVRFEF